VSGDLQTAAEIVRDLFDEYKGPVTRELCARDVEQWDSLMNVQLIVLVEQAFGVQFSSREVGQFQNLGELLDAVQIKRRDGI
jgi:acyl carrier protein